VALAALDFEGRLVGLRSKRNAGGEALLQMVSAYGPAVIASDTNPPSKLAVRLSKAFPCRLFFPVHSLTLREKYRMTAAFRPRNAHERDALAAALKAYHSVENKMRQVKKRAGRGSSGAVVSLSKAQAQVLRGRRMKDVA
jgi:hypothetical protein